MKINDLKSEQTQNKISNNNKIISDFDIIGKIETNKTNNYFQPVKNQTTQNYYNTGRFPNIPSTNYNQLFNNLNLDNQIQRNTFYQSNNNYIDPYFNIKNNTGMEFNNNMNFNKEVNNVEVKKNNQKWLLS